MTSRAKRTADRALLLSLVDALNVSKNNLSRDACGDWNIFGRRGHISSDGASMFVYLAPGTVRRWESAKRLLSFATVTQDGDDEGVFRLVDLPTAEQAETLRKLVGLRKVARLTATQRSTLRRFSFPRDKAGVSDQSIAFAEEAATHLAPTTSRHTSVSVGRV
jgi:hypothetical protein